MKEQTRWVLVWLHITVKQHWLNITLHFCFLLPYISYFRKFWKIVLCMLWLMFKSDSISAQVSLFWIWTKKVKNNSRFLKQINLIQLFTANVWGVKLHMQGDISFKLFIRLCSQTVFFYLGKEIASFSLKRYVCNCYVENNTFKCSVKINIFFWHFKCWRTVSEISFRGNTGAFPVLHMTTACTNILPLPLDSPQPRLPALSTANYIANTFIVIEEIFIPEKEIFSCNQANSAFLPGGWVRI